GVGQGVTDARRTLSKFGPELWTAIWSGRVIVSRGGFSFAWWEPRGDREWKLRAIASLPRGRGHGTHVLHAFLDLADQLGVPVMLHCLPSLNAWYFDHDFRKRPAGRNVEDREMVGRGFIVMRRPAIRRGDERAMIRYETSNVKTARPVPVIRPIAGVRAKRPVRNR
ncbi:MAG: hypothetical protein QOG49_1068, partial [Frankiaceae bacterium]|nr:hypothetical protein [Frankiaceae bacterium]